MKSGIINCSVKASSLSCLLNRNSTIEVLPEPFRLQPTVVFHVAYSEYIAYLQSLPIDSNIILSLPIDRLKTLVGSQSAQLYAHFLCDMAFALMKEVWFAEQYKTYGKIILPESTSGVTKLSDFLSAVTQMSEDSRGDFLSMIDAAGFRPSKVSRTHNKRLQQIALCLYHFSKMSNGMTEVSLVYDIV